MDQLAKVASFQTDGLKQNNELVVKVNRDLQNHEEAVRMITTSLEQVFLQAVCLFSLPGLILELMIGSNLPRMHLSR